ncbi:MAG: hypothetical protein HKN77_00470 [Woeseiaceae bacterium]|nr:hypothetical protein [Woeseiaceae bacterium]
MTTLRTLLITCLCVLFAPATSIARDVNLDLWVDGQLIPSIKDKLLSHPRFKGETVMFVVLNENSPAPVSNELALSLRDRLLDAALESDGIRVGWRQTGTNYSRNSSIDCTRNDVHYYIGIELSEQIDRRYEIKIRALDLEDRSWVGGFGTSWRGNLTSTQKRALETVQVDRTFLGARDVPFTNGQTDLLARHLAHELSCELFGQTSGRYVLPAPATNDDASTDLLDGALELIGRNIAAHSAISITSDPTGGNATLSAEAHVINDALHQYWLTIAPDDPDGELGAISVSAYVLIPNTALASNRSGRTVNPAITSGNSRNTRLRPQVSIPNSAGRPILGPLRVVSPDYESECRDQQSLYRASSRWADSKRCSLLEARSHSDAVVFVIEHQPHLGLVRLGGEICRRRTAARVVRGGEPMRFPIARFEPGTGQAKSTDRWFVAPTVDTFYAIAIQDAAAARQFANHIDKLPQRCGTSLRPGLSGPALRIWLDEFANLAARSVGSFDWRAIELKNVY